jgi:hypothetical protein
MALALAARAKSGYGSSAVQAGTPMTAESDGAPNGALTLTMFIAVIWMTAYWHAIATAVFDWIFQ